MLANRSVNSLLLLFGLQDICKVYLHPHPELGHIPRPPQPTHTHTHLSLRAWVPEDWTADCLPHSRAENGVEGAALGEVYQEAGAGMALRAGSDIRWCLCSCGESVL